MEKLGMDKLDRGGVVALIGHQLGKQVWDWAARRECKGGTRETRSGGTFNLTCHAKPRDSQGGQHKTDEFWGAKLLG